MSRAQSTDALKLMCSLRHCQSRSLSIDTNSVPSWTVGGFLDYLVFFLIGPRRARDSAPFALFLDNSFHFQKVASKSVADGVLHVTAA